MQFVVIIERRTTHSSVYIPALAVGSDVPASDDLRASAVALVSAAAGLPSADVQISLHPVRPGETLLSAPPTDVEVQHDGGAWYRGEHTGWLRHRDGSWKALVEYAAAGMTWKRAVLASRFRQPALDSLLLLSRA